MGACNSRSLQKKQSSAEENWARLWKSGPTLKFEDARKLAANSLLKWPMYIFGDRSDQPSEVEIAREKQV